MSNIRIDPVNESLLLLAQKGIVSKLAGPALKNKVHCSSCQAPRIEVALAWLSGSRRQICDGCRALAEHIEDSTDGHRFLKRALINTLKGITTFGLGKPFVAGAPRLLTWELTSQCNIGRCEHCYNDSKMLRKRDELTTEEAMAAVEQFAASGVLGIAFTGGEALLREDFFEIVSHAVSKGIACYMATNGSLLTQENAERLKNAGVCVVHVSLDSTDPSVHDTLRGTPGLHQRAIEGIKRCLDADLQVAISATAMRVNCTDIPNLLDLGDEMGVDWLLVYDFVPTGRGTIFLEPTPAEREQLFFQLWERSKLTRKTRLCAFSPQFAVTALRAGQPEVLPTHYIEPLVADSCRSLLKTSAGCMAGKYYLAMESNGDLKPCTFLPVTIGNIRTDDFDKVWNESVILANLRDSKKITGQCRSCSFSEECGGCRARAYAHTSDYLASDPGCPNAVRAGLSQSEKGCGARYTA